MALIRIVQGDNREALRAQLFKDGVPLDLTGCTVRFYMPPIVPESPVQVLNTTQGLILMPLEQSAVNTAGEFRFQFRVTWPDGRQITLPQDSHGILLVLPRLS